MAVLRRIQRGSATATAASNTVTVLAYDQAKTINFLTKSHSSSSPAATCMRMYPATSTTYTVDRFVATSDPTYSYEIIEFASGVTVQHITFNDPATSGTGDDWAGTRACNVISATTAFCLGTYRHATSVTTWDNSNYVTCWYDSTTTIGYSNGLTTEVSTDFHFQSITFDGSNVQSGNISSLAWGTATTYNHTSGLSAYTVNNTIAFATHYPIAGTLMKDTIACVKADVSAELLFTRAGAVSHTCPSTRFFIVDLNDRTVVENYSGNCVDDADDTTETVSITAAPPDASSAWLSSNLMAFQFSANSPSSTSASAINTVQHSVTRTDSTTVTLTRTTSVNTGPYRLVVVTWELESLAWWRGGFVDIGFDGRRRSMEY